MKVLMTPEGKKVQVDINEDKCLYDAPKAYPQEERICLYFHKAKSGKGYYYTYHWNATWLGPESPYKLITEDEAKAFALERASSGSKYVSDGVNKSNCGELWGEDYLSEDA